MSAQEPTEEELRAAFEEQMRRLTVPDVLVQTAVTLVNLGSQKLAEEHDLEQVKAAIDGTRALLPLLPEEVEKPVRDALSQLQMAFVRESQGGAQAPAGGEPAPQQPAPARPQEPAEQQPDDEDERAKARAKIWTPPGT
ncbi:MAG TPA: hypothetical protein VF712_09295 [Thermoleophilaceae bacterium]